MTAIALTEAQFQEQVIDLARLAGWRVAHFRTARTAKGWRTPVAADGAGFPDLLLARGGCLLIAELKSEQGRLSTEQRAWLISLRAVPGIDVRVWRPSDWPVIQQTLTSKETP